MPLPPLKTLSILAFSCLVWIGLISGTLAYFCGALIGGIAAGGLLLTVLAWALVMARSFRRDHAKPDNFLHERLTSPPGLKDSTACMRHPVKSN